MLSAAFVSTFSIAQRVHIAEYMQNHRMIVLSQKISVGLCTVLEVNIMDGAMERHRAPCPRGDILYKCDLHL